MNKKEMAQAAKGRLEELRGINNIIQRLETTYHETAEAMSVGNKGGGGVQTSGKSDPTARIAEKLASLREEINNQIDRLVDLKREIMVELGKVQNLEERGVLIAIYVQSKTLDEVADEEGKGRTWVVEKHGEALLSYAEESLGLSADANGRKRTKTA